MTIYNLDILLFLFGTSLLFHVQFQLLLPDLHTGFSTGRSGGLVFPSLSEFSNVHCDPHTQRLWHSNKAEIDVFLELSCFFHDPADVGNLISGSSTFSKTSLNIWKFMVHVLVKPGLENFEYYFIRVWWQTSWLWLDLDPQSYAILFFTALDFTSITSHIHNWVLFLLWLHLFILSGEGNGNPLQCSCLENPMDGEAW